MKTKFNSKAELIRDIEVGQPVKVENHLKPELSRETFVKNKWSYFFTLDKEGKESWIINGADQFKHIGLTFLPNENKVHLFWKKDNAPYLTLTFL